MTARGEAWLNRIWYGQSRWYLALLPLAWIFGALAAIRRRLYRSGLLASASVGVPVVVVGNLSAGGTGKTPVVIWLVRELAARGLQPGVVSRGYRGRPGAVPELATADGDPGSCGDEPLLIARRTGRPVAVHPDRVAAARLLASQGADVIVADDGLQHYRLRRDVEIAVVDGHRLWGNGRLLPAGPLREKPARLKDVDRVLVNDGDPGAVRLQVDGTVPVARFTLVPGPAMRVDGNGQRPLESLRGETVHAIAGMARPERFFESLEALGIDLRRHPLPDHASILPADLEFGDELPVLMTEKDAVKCAGFAHRRCWYVPVDLRLEGGADDWLDGLVSLLRSRTNQHD